VEEEVREGHPAEGDAKVAQMREVRLSRHARAMDLGEDDLLLRSVRQPPRGDVALEGAQLHRLIPAGLSLTEDPEERLGLEGRVAL
jgi:hypothetical protein